MGKYSIGIDFGFSALSAILLDTESGDIKATISQEYSNGVLENFGDDYTLFNPMIYLEALQTAVPKLIGEASVDKDDISGLGINFFSTEILPVMSDGTPLCFFDKFSGEPNAYAKLYGPTVEAKAEKLSAIASKRGDAFLARYGGSIEPCSMLPIVWDTLDNAPDVYNTCDYFIETADWIVWQLTGKQTRNACAAGVSALWNATEGYPDKDFYAALDPRLINLADAKLNSEVSPAGTVAGKVSPFVAGALGLSENTSVAVASFSAASSLLATKLTGEGQMLSFMDDYASHILLSGKENYVPGITSVSAGGVVPNLVSYEATQLGTCENLNWFVKKLAPAEYLYETDDKNITLHNILDDKAAKLVPGEIGLIALDWMSGNRAVMGDANLTGAFIGLTTETKAEEMYRALVEGCAFGMRTIIENFNSHSVPVKALTMTGELTKQSLSLINIFADVLKLPIQLVSDDSLSLIGAAIIGAVAGGTYEDLADASAALGIDSDITIEPDAKNADIYDKLYHEYTRLADYFGRGANDVMKRLNNIKESIKPSEETKEADMEDLIEDVYNAVDELIKGAIEDSIEETEEEEVVEETAEETEAEEVTAEEDTAEEAVEETVEEAEEVTAEEVVETAEEAEAEETPEEDTAEEAVEETVEEAEDDILEEEYPEELIEDLATEDGISEEEALSEEVEEAEETSEDAEETAEETVEEVVEEVTEEIAEEVTDETTEEMVEEAIEEAVEDVTEEVVEETAEDVTEESVDDGETVEDATEEVIEEAAEETAEEIVEEATEEAAEEVTETDNVPEIKTLAEEELEALMAKYTLDEYNNEEVVESPVEEAAIEASEEATENVSEEVTEETTDTAEEVEEAEEVEDDEDEEDPFVPTISSEFGEEYAYSAPVAEEVTEAAEEATEEVIEEATETAEEIIEETPVIPEKSEPSSVINRNSSIPSDFWNY